MPYKDIAQGIQRHAKNAVYSILRVSLSLLRSTTFMTSYCVVHPLCVFARDKYQHEWVTKCLLLYFHSDLNLVGLFLC